MLEEALFPAVIIILFVIIIIKAKMRPSGKWKDEVKQKLQELALKENSSDSLVLKALLLEMDKLLEHTMKSLGIPGITTGEKLKKAEKYFSRKQYDMLWSAHKVRNKIAHEAHTLIPQNDLKEACNEIKRSIYTLLK